MAAIWRVAQIIDGNAVAVSLFSDDQIDQTAHRHVRLARDYDLHQSMSGPPDWNSYTVFLTLDPWTDCRGSGVLGWGNCHLSRVDWSF
jgi:hypothetical protein